MEPHAHAIMIDPGNRYAFSPDLGLDKVLIYQLDAENGTLTPNTQPWVRVQPGAGPRHFDFHPNGQFAYVINEIEFYVHCFPIRRECGNVGGIPDSLNAS